MNTNTLLRERIARARARLGDARAEEILVHAENDVPAGKILTLLQRATLLESAITGVALPASRAQPKPNERSYAEWMAQYSAITDPFEKTAFYRANVAAMKAARVKALYPSAYVLKRGRRGR